LDQEKLNKKTKKLEQILLGYKSIIIAYSGGVDSTFLTGIAHNLNGLRVLAVTSNSPSVASEDLFFAKKVAKDFKWNHVVIDTEEINNPKYVSNDLKRCFYCKTELYSQLIKIAKRDHYKYIANGANIDDLSDYRPGMLAASDYEVVSPLVDSGFNKNDIRFISREMNLPSWNKPAQPCLSSRIPYGIPVSIKSLEMIGFAEKKIRNFGFPIVRVRYHGDLARIEIPLSDFEKFNQFPMKNEIQEIIFGVGFKKMELDPLGFRSGSLNK